MNCEPIYIILFISDSTYSLEVNLFCSFVVEPMSKERVATKKKRTVGGQTGGLAVLLIITAAIEAGKKLKPATKAKEALKKKFGEKYANNILYKIASVGQSLRFNIAPLSKRKRRSRKRKS